MITKLKIDEVVVGDYVRTRIKGTTRRGQVVSVHGPIVVLDSRAFNSPVPIPKSDIIEAWRFTNE